MADQEVEGLIARWQGTSGSEKANAQLFLNELCEALGLPKPDPAQEDTRDNTYVFERRVTFQHGDGTTTRGFIDLYRQGCFVLEAKGTGQQAETERWDKAMLLARTQAEGFSRALPPRGGAPALRDLRGCLAPIRLCPTISQ